VVHNSCPICFSLHLNFPSRYLQYYLVASTSGKSIDYLIRQ
jgi:hypothetical protein